MTHSTLRHNSEQASSGQDKFYITTPIFYVNDAPHLGHAYTAIAADVLARYYRGQTSRHSSRQEVYFLTGTDEHGAKIAQAAQEAGESPEKFVDGKAIEFKKAWQKLSISYDYFVRTTDKEHEKYVGDFVTKLYEAGFIYKGAYKGLYCVACEEYKSPSDLVNGKCPAHQSVPETISEETYFFRLSDFQEKLIEIYEKDQIILEPVERKNEVLGFLKSEKLKDVAITRTKVSWGIKCPWDKKHTIYVWVDALLNYLSAAKGNWPADLHIIGKDILRFHAVIWPALLLAAELPLPKKIFVHGYFTIAGQKMSKTIGNVIEPVALSKKYGIDALRYTILREFPFGSDGDISVEAIERRYNSDLANDLGNLILRVIKLANNYNLKLKAKSSRSGGALKPQLKSKNIENLRFQEELIEIWEEIRALNQRVEKEKLWEESPKSKKAIGEILISISQIAYRLSPFMPNISEKILKIIKNGKAEVLFPKS